jgi:uncharacterized protein (DUF58 family)
VTRRSSPRLGAYAGLSALGLLAALVLGRPELVALAAPFALLLAIGLLLAREPDLAVAAELPVDRVLEGDDVTLTVRVAAAGAVERLEVLLALPDGLDTDGDDNPVALWLSDGEERALSFTIHCRRWGAYRPGEIHLRARDRLGLLMFERAVDARSPLKVYPRPEQLLEVLKPLETQVFAGNHVSRVKGDGIEFADLRPFVPGDRVRRINWRASARRGELIVNEHHPERNTDVILFLDSFSEARALGAGTLDLTVRAAAALAEGYLARKDRVGLVSFGGVLNWLLPATGLVQVYRIVDSLLDTEIVLSYAWKDIDIIPLRTLPPKALVIALSPLLDERTVGAMLDLRARGFDLAIVEVSPVPFAPPGGSEPERLAHRLWRHRRAALRYRFERAGIAVAEWRDDVGLVSALEEVSVYRRRAGVARA